MSNRRGRSYAERHSTGLEFGCFHNVDETDLVLIELLGRCKEIVTNNNNVVGIILTQFVMNAHAPFAGSWHDSSRKNARIAACYYST